MRYVLPLFVLLAALGNPAAFGETDRIQLAQSSQTVQPAPQPQLLPQSTTTNACVINCDTVAMNCTNGCIVVAPTTAAAANTGQCNLACTTQQLVCKQGCSSISTGR